LTTITIPYPSAGLDLPLKFCDFSLLEFGAVSKPCEQGKTCMK